MDIKRLQELLTYDKESGKIVRTSTNRVIEPDSDGFTVVYDNATKKNKKFKPLHLAYMLGYNKDIPDGMKVIGYNTNDLDTSFRNLKLLDDETYKQVKSAIRNISDSGIQMLKQEPDKRYDYKVFWYHNGVKKNKGHLDIVSAQRHVRQLKLFYTKLITFHCITD